jgi:uncharacterized membrane protein
MLSLIMPLIIVISIDYLWLGIAMKKFYLKELSKVSKIREKFNIASAGIVYLLLAFGISYFIIPNSSNLLSAIINGAILGLIIYGVYDLTNYSVFEKFSLKMSIIDIIWGAILCACASMITYLI